MLVLLKVAASFASVRTNVVRLYVCVHVPVPVDLEELLPKQGGGALYKAESYLSFANPDCSHQVITSRS